MPKRRSNERGGGPIPKHRHLYLVLDDWSRGYTIRKIDLLPDPVASYPSRQIITGGFLGKQRLPPPIIRVDAARGLPKHLVASGRHLMFMQPSDRWIEEPTFKFFPIVDVAMRSTVFCRLPIDFPSCLPIGFPDKPIYMPLGGSIYILDTNCFFVLTPASSSSSVAPASVLTTASSSSSVPADLQKLNMLPNQPVLTPSSSSSSMPADLQKLNMLPNPPFERKNVISYTHYASTLYVMSGLNGSAFIFAFNIMEGIWYQKGVLPFFDHMHFDPVLDAFVGLSTVMLPGHIRITYMDGSTKDSKEKLFSRADPVEQDIKAEKQLGCTLVYMGSRSNFCLVECISHDQTKCNNNDVSVHSCSFFRLTPFFLKYDKNGDLRIVKLQVQYYNVPQGVTESALKNPAAFWM